MYKKIISVLLSFIIVFSCLLLPGSAENNSAEPFMSNNILNYANTRWASPVYSYLYADGSNITRIEIGNSGNIYIEAYNKSYDIVSSALIECELEYTCGVYIGQTYNYAVFASLNVEENNNKEIVRVVKYSKSWERLGNASAYGSNTTVFADAGSLRFTEYGNYLYIHSSHEMYTSSDGLNHQANMTLVIDTSSMTVTCSKHIVSNTGTGYVSHSFNQFIAADEDTDSIVTVDHGDAYPRAVAIFRYNGQLGNSSLSNPTMVTIFNIKGAIGDNTTGVSVGDLTVTDNNYIVAFNSIEQGSASTDRSPYIAIVPKNSFSNNSVKLVKLDVESSSCGYPYITDIGGGKYVVTWEKDDSVAYVTIDENGTLLTEIAYIDAQLSDCEPIYTDSKVIWYVTDYSAPVFYSIDTKTNSGSIDKCMHAYEETVISKESCVNDGKYKYLCSFCGDSYESTVDAWGHTDSNSDGWCETCGYNASTEITDVTATWDKDSYTTNDTEAVLSLSTTDVYIDDITVDCDSGSYSYEWTLSSCKLLLNGEVCSYTLYIQLSDGQIITTSVDITEANENDTNMPDEPDDNTTPDQPNDNTTPDEPNDNTTPDEPDDKPTTTVTWEKDSYYASDGQATLTVNAADGIFIQDIEVAASSCWSASWCSTTCTIDFDGVPGAYTVYLYMSDGQTVTAELNVENDPENDTDIPDEPSDEPTYDEDMFADSDYTVSDNGLILTNIPEGTTYGELLLEANAAYMTILSYDVSMVVNPNADFDFALTPEDEKKDFILKNFTTQVVTGDTVVFHDEDGNVTGEFICELQDDSYVDFDNDGYITSDDAIYLLKNTMNPFYYPTNGKMDLDSDSYVTTDDAIYLLKHTMLADAYPIY